MDYFRYYREVKPRRLMDGVDAHPLYIDDEEMVIAMVLNRDIPVHSHENTQYGVIVDGKGLFYIGGRERLVERGVFYYIPGGVEHGLRIIEGPVIAIDIFRPPREDYRWIFTEFK